MDKNINKNNQGPCITVLMPVYNGAKYLIAAVDSILNQSFPNFEFLIIDDGSSDETADLLKSYKDPRVKILKHDKNRGFAYSLNEGIKLAMGKYIARMDVDDISLPDRLYEQIKYLDNHSEVDIIGSSAKRIGVIKKSFWMPPLTHNEIKATLLFESSFAHPTVMVRNKLCKMASFKYIGKYRPAEDYELWSRIADVAKMGNLKQVLLFYRIHSSQDSSVYSGPKEKSAAEIRAHIIIKTGIIPSKEELRYHQMLADYRISDDGANILNKIFSWVNKIIESNNKTQYFNSDCLEKIIALRWTAACINLVRSNHSQFPKTIAFMVSSPLVASFFLKGVVFWIIYKIKITKFLLIGS